MPVSRNIQQGCSSEETCFTTFVRKTLLTSLLPLRDRLHLPRRHSHLPLIENLENLNQLELERLLLDDSESEFLELVIELSLLEFNELEGSLESEFKEPESVPCEEHPLFALPAFFMH